MLTFQFTGVDGLMTESEILTSGMVGKEVQLLFDDSWTSLSKTVVFRAGDTSRVVTEASSTVTIPEDALARPFCRLYVGVYGTDTEGSVVIPTIMAEGPMIQYGADPMEDETAKDLPVWQNLQNQIGDLSLLETGEKEDLVTAINELNAGQDTLDAGVSALESALTASESGLRDELGALRSDLSALENALTTAESELQAEQETLRSDLTALENVQTRMGDPTQLETNAKETFVAAVNELHRGLEQLAQDCVGFNATAAQLLIDILSRGTYADDQTENIAALAGELGAQVPVTGPVPIVYWDFTTGSWVDQIAGLEASCSEGATIDASGAHTASDSDYIHIPLGPDGATLEGNILEIKFGEMTLEDTGSTMRLAMAGGTYQPLTTGMIWSIRDCWTAKSSVSTEFTDLQMFSGKVITGKPSEDGTELHWYFEDQFICAAVPGFAPTHVSLGSSVAAAYPLTVEYIKIYPAE